MAKTADRKTSDNKARDAATPASAPEATAATPAQAVAVKKPKAAAKPRAATKTVTKTAAKAPVASDKTAKVKKPKLVRDSFTMPKTEYAVIDELKLRAAQLGHPVKKSELLRAGIKALAALNEAALLAALANVPAIKTGRPSQTQA